MIYWNDSPHKICKFIKFSNSIGIIPVNWFELSLLFYWLLFWKKQKENIILKVWSLQSL